LDSDSKFVKLEPDSNNRIPHASTTTRELMYLVFDVVQGQTFNVQQAQYFAGCECNTPTRSVAD